MRARGLCVLLCMVGCGRTLPLTPTGFGSDQPGLDGGLRPPPAGGAAGTTIGVAGRAGTAGTTGFAGMTGFAGTSGSAGRGGSAGKGMTEQVICRDGEVQACACPGSTLQGKRRCRFNVGSMSSTSFGPCEGCDSVSTSRCGNSVREGPESCDGPDVGAASCKDFGFSGGMLRCNADCGYDTSACTRCGDGVIQRESGEACDGKDLNDFDCVQLGFQGGELRCSPATCHFDNSGCDRAMPTNCVDCGHAHCQAAIDACTSQQKCVPGLACLSQMCGPNPVYNCAAICLGDQSVALSALGMFACLVDQCGPECVGAF
jgi:hypothetical protein